MLRDSVAELKRLKEEVTELAKQKMISEARQKIEDDAKRIMEQILQDKADEESTEGEPSEAPVQTLPPAEAENTEPVLTTIAPGDDFGFDTPATPAENEVTPTVTTTTDDQGNVDIVIDTNPGAEPEVAPVAGPAPIQVAPVADPEADSVLTPEVSTEVNTEETPNEEEEEIEELDMRDASAEEILEKFCETNQAGTLAEVEQVANPEAQGGSTEDDELAAFLDEALELAKSGGLEDEEGEEEIEALSEEEMAEIEARLDEDQLDDMNGGEPTVPPRGNTGTTNIMGDDEDTLEETIAQNHTNGRHKNVKPSNFPEDRKRPAAVNEAKQNFVKLQKQVAKIIAENKSLKEEVSNLTTLNEGLEENMGQYRLQLYEAMMVSYKTGHVNKLLMEQTTTKDQKEQILESFFNANSREEVTQLYESFIKKLQKGENNSLLEGKSVAQKLAPVFIAEAGDKKTEVLNEGLRSDPNVMKMMRIINFKHN